MAVILQSQKEVDLSSGLKVNAEVVDGKLQLKVIGQTLKISDKSIVPIMTSNTSPAPFVASASSTYSYVFEPFKAFNGNNSDGWASSYLASLPQWLKIDLGQQKLIRKYAISVVDGNNESPRSWRIEGSNDDLNWNVIHTVINEPYWSARERREYYNDQYGLYRFYRIVIIEHFGGARCAIGEFELFGENYFDQYFSYGVAEYGPFDLGFHFREIISLSIIKNIPHGTDIKIYTSTSNDYVNYSDWSLVDEDGNITSPQGRYVKIKVELIGNQVEVERILNDFNESESNQFQTDNQVIFDGSLRLKTEYIEPMNLDLSWGGEGKLFKQTIRKSDFKKIESIEVV